jgi:hypothetical protein
LDDLFIHPTALSFIKVLSDEGKAKAIAFDEIDKAPEEKARGITIATVPPFPLLPHSSFSSSPLLPPILSQFIFPFHFFKL